MGKTVLIVEDEFLIAMVLQSILEEHGWQVMGPAATVKAALDLLRDELPSVALLDVNLGKELVTPVAEFLRAHSVPFAIASAYEHPEKIAGAVLADVTNVGKPAGESLLLRTLEDLKRGLD